MPTEPPSRALDKFVLRFPDGMRDRIAAEAKANGRSMNAEIIARLEKTLEDDDLLAELAQRVERLEAKVDEHDYQLGVRDSLNHPD